MADNVQIELTTMLASSDPDVMFLWKAMKESDCHNSKLPCKKRLKIIKQIEIGE